MSFLKLLYWLGPWTDQQRSPIGTERQRTLYRSRNNDHPLWVYRGHSSSYPLYLIPGIQHQGPDDPRLDRFARVLAHAGYVVGVPALPTMIELRMEPELLEDVYQSFLHFSNSCSGKVAVFSISASSIAGLQLGARTESAGRISQMMLFGGYSDWVEALTFAVDGHIDSQIKLKIDPLNLPVVMLNLIEAISVSEDDRKTLHQAWHRYVCEVWENPQYAQRSAYQPVAEQIALSLPSDLRALFLQGCSVRPGGAEWAKSLIRNCSKDTAWLDPLPALKQVKCPLHVAHGREDVVVPYTHAEVLVSHHPKAHIYVTGLAHHAGVHRFSHYIGQIPTLVFELVKGARLLRAISQLWRH